MAISRELKERIDVWRRFSVYRFVSRNIVALWNSVVSVLNEIETTNPETLEKNYEEYIKKFDEMRAGVIVLERYVNRIKWFSYARVDYLDAPKAKRYKNIRLGVVKFPTALKKISDLIRMARELLEDSLWREVTYVYTFISTKEKNNKARHIEAHAETYVRKKELEVLKNKIEVDVLDYTRDTVMSMFLRDAGYEFMIEYNTVASPNNWRIGKLVGRIKQNKLRLEIYDYDQGQTKAIANGTFDEKAYYQVFSPREIYSMLEVSVFARRTRGRPRTRQTTLFE